jgi:hypothetical protein
MTQPEPYPIDEPKPGDPGAPPLKARIEKPGLIEGFEEDADFTKDPELDRVVLGEPSRPAVITAAPAALKDEFVKPAWPWEDKFWAAVGALLLIAAMIASGINVLHAAEKAVTAPQRILNVLLTLYNTLLHTGTGLAAVFATAMLLGQRVGRIETAAARMFAAVAAFEFLYNLKFTITTGKTEEAVLAAAAYLAVVATSFRLFKRDPFLYLIGLHFAIWLVVQVGMLLAAAARVA